MNARSFAGSAVLNGNATAQTLKAAPNANAYVYVTKVTISVTTHADGKKTSIQDSNSFVFGTVVDHTAAAGVKESVVYDFGRRGIQLGQGKDFQVVGEAVGSAGVIEYEGYVIGS